MYTLTYARGTLHIDCIRFKHGRIRWHTARQKYFYLSILESFVHIWTYDLYARHSLYLSKFTFQKKLKHRLVELLAKADDYLEITQIIHAIKLT